MVYLLWIVTYWLDVIYCWQLIFINEWLVIHWWCFIVGVSDWWITFIDDNCYLLVIVLVTLDIDFEVIVYFWSWYLYVDLIWDVSIGMSSLLILIISSSWLVCVTLEVVLAIKILWLGLFYNLIICVWIIYYLSGMVGVEARLGDHAVKR